MTARLSELESWLAQREDEHLEFKEAKNNFHFEKLVKYCCALANEGGGRMLLGVTDKVPHRVVGTSVFVPLERAKAGLIERLRLRIRADEIRHPDGRVVVFEVPSRPVGTAIQYEGAYWMRAGEELAPMTEDMLRRIFAEAQPDFSALLCPEATLTDLDPAAIERFRAMWQRRAPKLNLEKRSVDQLLEDAELLVDGRVTYAALILLGTQRALGRHLGQAEVIFEYRSDEASIAYRQRKEYRQGFLLYDDDLWQTINLRNDLFSYQDGLVRREIPAFNELAVREAILNAVSHRDYRMAGSVFVKQWPTKIQIVSPGGFPPEITPENILFHQSPRNRRLAEALARCGLVERSGQGADVMFEAAVRDGKLPPDFSGSDAHQVSLILPGTVQDERFLKYLDRIAQATKRTFAVDDLVVLDAVHRARPVPAPLKTRIDPLLDLGVLERVARGRLVLSQKFYEFVKRPGEYTRKRGLDRATNKALLKQHIAGCGAKGCPIGDLLQVLPALTRNQIRVLLREMSASGEVHFSGVTINARWFDGPGNVGPEIGTKFQDGPNQSQ